MNRNFNRVEKFHVRKVKCLVRATERKMSVWRMETSDAQPSMADPFTDLLDLRSIMGHQGALAQYLRALFEQKDKFTVYFSGKGRWLLHPNTAQRSIFFSRYNLFLEKLKEILP